MQVLHPCIHRSQNAVSGTWCKYDGHCQRYCAVADHWVFLEAFAGHERDAYRHGIVYVDAWKDVRRRIDGIQILYHLREDIVICKGLRP